MRRALPGVLMSVSWMLQITAASEESILSTPALPRFEPIGTVFGYEGLRYRPHDDVIFPSLVATGGRFPNPLGRYYLYYAAHDAPGGICMAYADDLHGPWKEFAENPLVSRDWKPHYQVSHVSGPHALWNEAEKRVFLYFHGENSETRLATSRDGIHFDYDRTVITTADFPGVSETSYARVFEHKLPDVDNRFLMLLMGNDHGTRRIYLAWSKDGRAWTPRAEPFMDPPPGTDQVAGAWLLPWKGRNHIIAHANANRGDGINGNGFDLYLNEVNEDFSKARPVGKFMAAAAFGAENPALMSPCLFEENGSLYLFVNIGPRLNNTIALAVAKP
ncbi:MAG: hypothetical protein RLZZ214_1923 [Verrucomicrobiota bacterium]